MDAGGMVVPGRVAPADLDPARGVGIVTEIERYAIHDGPGIRTTVFLKGCPLRCQWCCNPETQLPMPEMVYAADKCIKCLRCVESCPFHAISIDERNELRTDRGTCARECQGRRLRHECTRRCYSQARRTVGYPVAIQDVRDEVVRDYQFYERTGGGLTVSGGEPLAQAGFVLGLLSACRERWIGCAMETCGFGKWDDLREILKWLDVAFFDIKTMDRARHVAYAGVPNDIILDNARKAASAAARYGVRIVVRVPIVPGFNDSIEDVEAIARFVSGEMVGVSRIELLPYHKLGRGKYRILGREYSLANLEPPTPGRIRELEGVIKSFGLEVSHH